MAITNGAPLKYEVEIEIAGDKTNDINSWVIFRCPLAKTSSYAIIDFQIQSLKASHLSSDIAVGKFPEIKVRTYIVDSTVSKFGNTPGERVIDLGYRNYIAIFASTNEHSAINSEYSQLTLYLVNPILYYLNSTNSYNKILENINGLGIITGFEGYLKSTFGARTFDFIKVGESTNKNEFLYEQILIRLENDLQIPTWAIQIYKVFNSYSFYFFDDFKIDESTKSDIVGFLINIGDIKVFPKYESLLDAKIADVVIGNKFISATPIGDRFKRLDQTSTSMIFKGANCEFSYKKAEGQAQVPTTNISNSKSQKLGLGRSVKSVEPSLSIQSKPPTHQTLIYAPDDISNSKSRLEKSKLDLKENIEGVYRYYMRDAHLDFLQFGKSYNLSPLTPHEYIYTPINIVNIFIRDSGKVPILVHNMHYQMLKFKGES